MRYLYLDACTVGKLKGRGLPKGSPTRGSEVTVRTKLVLCSSSMIDYYSRIRHVSAMLSGRQHGRNVIGHFSLFHIRPERCALLGVSLHQ